MIKLYRFSQALKECWETWEDGDGNHTVHWGELGSRGQHKTVTSGLWRNAQAIVQKERDAKIAEGFAERDEDAHAVLLVEYAIQGMGSAADLDKRHRLEERLGDTLGWTGLGACDGGSIGRGTMEACVYVVDAELAKNVIAADLAGTEFADYTRIYEE